MSAPPLAAASVHLGRMMEILPVAGSTSTRSAPMALPARPARATSLFVETVLPTRGSFGLVGLVGLVGIPFDGRHGRGLSSLTLRDACSCGRDCPSLFCRP